MKKIWTLIACTLMAASISFAQDDFDSESTDQAEEQVADQASEPWPDEAEQTSDAESEEDASSVQTAKQSNNQVTNQTNIQQANQVSIQNNYYAQANEAPAEEPVQSRAEESRFGFGVRGAFDYGIMYGFSEEDDDMDETPKGIGFEFGVAARIDMIPNLYFTPEVNIAYIKTSHKFLERKREYASMDLEIPVLMRGVVAEKFYVTAGPQFIIHLSDDFDQEDIELEFGQFPFEENIEQGAFTFGIAAGAGFNLVDKLFIDLRFYMGLMELFPDVKSADDLENLHDSDLFSSLDLSGAKMMKIKIGLSYWFM